MTEAIARHLRYLAEKELNVRLDALHRAKTEYARGVMQADELADYEHDVAFEKEVVKEATYLERRSGTRDY